MQRRDKFLTSAAFIALTACGSEQGKLQIRSTPVPVSAVAKSVPLRIAEARGQLALGNVALALESYRKASREQPQNIEAFAGMAACYDLMGRFDLSRRYYESALAIAPADQGLLTALASSLDQQGKKDEAAAVRREISTRIAAATPPPATLVEKPTVEVRKVAMTAAPAPARSVTIILPPARPIAAPKPVLSRTLPAPPATPAQRVAIVTPSVPVPAAKPVEIAARDVRPAAPQRAVAAVQPTPAAVATPVRQPTRVIASPPLRPPAPARPVAIAAANLQPVPLPKVAIIAPEARVSPTPRVVAAAQIRATVPVAPVAVAVAVAVPPPEPAEPVVAAARTPLTQSEGATSMGARLERLSLGEVALLTSKRPQWRAQMVSRSDRSTTVRFVPLRTAGLRMPGVRLLNAARHQSLAALTRSYLAGRGWRQIAIGDAPQMRNRSVILYPRSRRATAQRLAAQFGFAIVMRSSGTDVVMLLGRDAARKARIRATG